MKLFGKKKKKKRTRKEIRRDLRKDFLAKARDLEKTIGPSENPSREFEALADLSREYFRKFFVIRYEPTNEELAEEIHKKRLDKKVKRKVEKYLRSLTEVHYSPAQEITKKIVESKLDAFMSLMDEVYADVMEVSLEDKVSKTPLIKRPKEIFSNFVDGFKVLGRWGELITKLAGQLVAPRRFRNSEAEMEKVMEYLADGYEALEDEKIRKAEKLLEKIQKKLDHFTLDERKAVESEIAAYKREIAFYKEENEHPDIPTSSAPEPVTESKEKKKPDEVDEDELENFVRLAIEHEIEPPMIRQRLLENGWPESQVDRVLRRFF